MAEPHTDLVPHTSAEPVPVDPSETVRTVHATITATRDHDVRPIIPAWLRSRADRVDMARWLVRYSAHVTAFHTTRAPLYAMRLAARAPRGLLVGLVAIVGWLFDREAAPLRREAVTRADPDDYLRLSKQRNDRVKRRAVIAGAVALGVIATGLVLVFWAPSWLCWVAMLAGVAVLGAAGTPADQRVTDVVLTQDSAPPRLSAEVVTRALSSLGIAAMTSKGATLGFPAPITRDGPGWRADVDLPFGVTVSDVAERREKLASGLRRPLGCVWPEPAPESHAGRLVLWVGDQPLAAVRPPVWPLARAGAVSLLAGGFPFGTDQRGRVVSVCLAETNLLIGALPGGGKTAAVRVLALAAALDPTAEIRASEHKGSGDLAALAQVAHRYVSGVSDAAIAATVASLRELHAELARRAEVLAKLPREVCPDSKVTAALAARRSLGLHPIVMVIDEAQEVFSHDEFGAEAGKLAEAIIKRGRALGVILIVATQRPDAKSLPTGVSTNVGVRFCLRVMDQTANDMVLGTSMYKAGVRATTLSPRDKGVGFLVGHADDPQVVRTYYVDAAAAERIAARARAAREAAGLLTGHALGDDEGLTRAASLLNDLSMIFAHTDADRLWREDVVRLLEQRWPDRYGALTPDGLTAAVKPLGIATAQVWGRTTDGTGANRRGITREAITEAARAAVATLPVGVEQGPST